MMDILETAKRFLFRQKYDPGITSFDIASFIARECRRNNYQYDCIKLNLLLYCVYITVLWEYDIRICLEHTRACALGPVFPSLLAYLQHGGDIENYPRSSDRLLCSSLKRRIAEIVKDFGGFNTDTLLAWCTQKESPWEKTASKHGTSINACISARYVRDYFSGISQEQAAV